MRMSLADAYNSDDMKFGQIRLIYPQAKKDKSGRVIESGKGVFRAVICSPLSLSGSNTFESPLEGAGMANKVMKGMNYVTSVAGLAGGSTGQSAMISKSQSMAFYQGSTKPPITFEYCLMCTDASQSIIDQVALLFSAVYPTGNELLTAPLGYTGKLLKVNGRKGITEISPSAQGVMSLRIGSWFYARNLIMKDMSVTFSKEVTRTGEPLFATGSVTLEPFRTISYEDLMGYFRKDMSAKNSGLLSQFKKSEWGKKASSFVSDYNPFA